MQTLAILANVLAGVVFLWLTYKTVCTGAATPARCRLLSDLRLEFASQGRRLVADVERLAKQPRYRSPRELAAAVAKRCDLRGAAARAGLPPDYRPAEILHRIATARLAGDADLAWDEYRHWLRRIAFDWPSRLSYGKQAKEFGLLFTARGRCSTRAPTRTAAARDAVARVARSGKTGRRSPAARRPRWTSGHRRADR